MDDDRTTGVTEARFALTLVICVLVAIGYVVLLRLGGGTSHSTIENRPDIVVLPSPPPDIEDVPRVLPVDVPDGSGSRPQEIAARPDLTPGEDAKSRPAVPPSPSSDSQRR